MTHSPEPWKTDIWCDGPVQILDASENAVAGFITDFMGILDSAIHSTPEDLRRIVACVNACEGIETHDLEEILRNHGTIAKYIRTMGVCAGDTELVTRAIQ